MSDRVFIDGVDQPLPEGEHLLWQGRPLGRVLARRVFHVRWLVAYFVALGLLAAFTGETGTRLARVAWLAVLGAAVVGMVYGYAVLTARHSVYALTDRRLVMRVGLAFPSVFNLPWHLVGDAWIREHQDGSGDLALQIRGSDRIGYAFLWPHVRPRHLRDPQPMMRGLADVAEVGRVVRRAVEASPRAPQTTGTRKRVHYSLLDDDGVEVLSNRAPEPTVGAR